MAETTDVVVVGAGPAGLAVAACLGKVGLDFIILERNLQIASSWRRHYERLHLHTIKQLSSLPYFPYPKDYPRYVPRNLLIEHLDRYAAHFDLRPRFGESPGARLAYLSVVVYALVHVIGFLGYAVSASLSPPASVPP